MKVIVLLSLLLLSGGVFAHNGHVNTVDILVYDAEIEENCSPGATGCIKMRVVLNGEEEHEWSADIGTRGFGRNSRLWRNEERVPTRNFEGGEITRIQNFKIMNSGESSYYIPVLLNDMTRPVGHIVGARGVTGNRENWINADQVSIELENMEKLVTWIKDANSVGGEVRASFTVPPVSALSLRELLSSEDLPTEMIDGSMHLVVTGRLANIIMGINRESNSVGENSFTPSMGRIKCVKKGRDEISRTKEFYYNFISSTPLEDVQSICFVPVFL